MTNRPLQASSAPSSRRLRRERHTVGVMVGMYCRAHHGSQPHDGGERLCPDCAALLNYASRRIDSCRFGEHKPTCARCTVHCFRASERERIRVVMRYAGPRMILRHPVLAMWHLVDRRHAPGQMMNDNDGRQTGEQTL